MTERLAGGACGERTECILAKRTPRLPGSQMPQASESGSALLFGWRPVPYLYKDAFRWYQVVFALCG
jgi:hypothetical protein